VELITTTPALSMNMLADLSRRLRAFTVQIEALSLKEVPARLAAYILTLSKEQKNSARVRLPISKAQLSNLIGTTPETISRMFKKMGETGLITRLSGLNHCFLYWTKTRYHGIKESTVLTSGARVLPELRHHHEISFVSGPERS
jgi:hypothetical protein